MKKILYSKKVAPFVFICPFVLTVLIFWLFPVLKSILLSFQSLNAGNYEWIGLKNYKQLLNDRIFLVAIKNTLKYTLGGLLLLVPIPMILACIINSKIMRHTYLIKTIYFIPALTSVVVAGTIFRLALGESDSALLNQILLSFGKEPIKWLKNPLTGYISLLLLACWRWTGVNMMYFIAGLQNIPTELYESAALDGAGAWQKLVYVSVPLLKPTTTYVLTVAINSGLSMFIESYMLWKGNNSPGNIGLTIVGYLYRQGIEKNSMAYASAVGIVLLLTVMVLNLFQLSMLGFFKKEERL